jgi:hypothetical protein
MFKAFFALSRALDKIAIFDEALIFYYPAISRGGLK